MDWLTLAYYGVIVAWAGWFFVRPAITITFGLEEHDRRRRRYRREQAKEGAGAGLLEGWKRAQESQHAETIAEIREIIEAPGNPPNAVLLGPEAERAITSLRDFVGLAGESEHTMRFDQRLTEISASYLGGREWFNAERMFPLVPMGHTVAGRAPEDLPDEPGRVEIRPADYQITTMLELPTEYERVDSEVARRVAAQIAEETDRSIIGRVIQDADGRLVGVTGENGEVITRGVARVAAEPAARVAGSGRLQITTPDGRTTEVDLSSWTLDMESDRVEVTSFGDAHRTYVQGLPSISGTFRGRWDGDHSRIGHPTPKPAEPKTATLRERRRAMELEDSKDE